MDGQDDSTPLAGIENRVQVDNALRAIHEKKPIPEIDFTLHTMEDGTQVNTMERVCKGRWSLLLPRSFRGDLLLTRKPNRCAGACHAPAN